MTIDKTVSDKEIILKLKGWLDAKTAPELGKIIEEIESAEKTLVLDLSELEYISSAGTRQIIYGYKKMGGKFLLKNVQESIMGILTAIGLDKKIPIE